MKKEKCNQDEIVFNEWENGDKLYLIKKLKFIKVIHLKENYVKEIVLEKWVY